MKRLIAEIDSYQWDNEQLYDNIESSVNKIESQLDSIKSIVDSCPTEYNDEEEKDTIWKEISDYIDEISYLADDVHDFASDAKNNGIYNEDQLASGKKQIEELESTLNDLKDELSEIDNSHDGLLEQVDDLENKIDNIKNQLNDKNSSTASNLRLKKSGSSYNWICDANEAIKNESKAIESACDNFGGSDKNYNDYQTSIDTIEDSISGIYSAVQEARDMNEKMGKGIDNKNDFMSNLNDEINCIKNEMEDSGITKEQLEDKLSDLNDILEELENQL